MNKPKAVFSDKAPSAVGPYSQGIKVDHLIFVSGQLPVDPDTGTMPPDIQQQTHQSLKNLQAVLEAAGSSLANVVKTTVFIKNMNDFGKINEVYAQYFGTNPPARSLVEVASLPKGALIEIEAIAVVN